MKMQECVKFLKKEISDLNDQNTKKDIEILSLQKELKDVSRQRNQLEESVKKLKEGKRQNNYTEEDAEDNKLLKLEIQSLQKKLANYEK
jgi:cell division protein FtsB